MKRAIKRMLPVLGRLAFVVGLIGVMILAAQLTELFVGTYNSSNEILYNGVFLTLVVVTGIVGVIIFLGISLGPSQLKTAFQRHRC